MSFTIRQRSIPVAMLCIVAMFGCPMTPATSAPMESRVTLSALRVTTPRVLPNEYAKRANAFEAKHGSERVRELFQKIEEKTGLLYRRRNTDAIEDSIWEAVPLPNDLAASGEANVILASARLERAQLAQQINARIDEIQGLVAIEAARFAFAHYHGDPVKENPAKEAARRMPLEAAILFDAEEIGNVASSEIPRIASELHRLLIDHDLATLTYDNRVKVAAIVAILEKSSSLGATVVADMAKVAAQQAKPAHQPLLDVDISAARLEILHIYQKQEELTNTLRDSFVKMVTSEAAKVKDAHSALALLVAMSDSPPELASKLAVIRSGLERLSRRSTITAELIERGDQLHSGLIAAIRKDLRGPVAELRSSLRLVGLPERLSCTTKQGDVVGGAENTSLGRVACSFAVRNATFVDDLRWATKSTGEVLSELQRMSAKPTDEIQRAAAGASSALRELSRTERQLVLTVELQNQRAKALLENGRAALALFDKIPRTPDSLKARQVVADGLARLVKGQVPHELRTGLEAVENGLAFVRKLPNEVSTITSSLRTTVESIKSMSLSSGMRSTVDLAKGILTVADTLKIPVPPTLRTAVSVASNVVSAILSSNGNPLSIAKAVFGGIPGLGGRDPELEEIHRELREINAKLDVIDRKLDVIDQKLDAVIELQQKTLKAINELSNEIAKFHAEEMIALQQIVYQIKYDRAHEKDRNFFPHQCNALLAWVTGYDRLRSQQGVPSFPHGCDKDMDSLLHEDNTVDPYLFVPSATGTEGDRPDATALTKLWSTVRNTQPEAEPIGIAIALTQVPLATDREQDASGTVSKTRSPWSQRFFRDINPTYLNHYFGHVPSYQRLKQPLDAASLLNVFDSGILEESEQPNGNPQRAECYAHPLAAIAVWNDLFNGSGDAEKAWSEYLSGKTLSGDMLSHKNLGSRARQLLAIIDRAIEQESLLEGAASVDEWFRRLGDVSQRDDALILLQGDANAIARRNIMLAIVASTSAFSGAYDTAYRRLDLTHMKDILEKTGAKWAATGLTLTSDSRWLVTLKSANGTVSVDFEMPTPVSVGSGVFEQGPLLKRLLALKQWLVFDLSPLYSDVVNDADYALLQEWVALDRRSLIEVREIRLDSDGQAICGP